MQPYAFTSQLIAQGTVSQTDIVKAFGVPRITVKRYVKLLREAGSKGFFATPKRRSAPVLTPEVRSRVQALLDAGKSVPEVGKETQVRADTLHKAIRAGRLKKSC
jgi:DNA invertase Pin-like site-specific DNA recombinase